MSRLTAISRQKLRRKTRSAPRDTTQAGPLAVTPELPALQPEQQTDMTTQQVLQLQRQVGNRRAQQLLHLPERDHATLPPVRGLKPAGTPTLFRKLPPRANIQRNPLQEAIAPHLVRISELAKKGGKKLLEQLELAKDNVGQGVESVKGKVKYTYDMHKAKDQLKEKEKAKTNKKEKGKLSKLLNYTFGTDFTFESKLSDNLENMPNDMAALQLQMESIGTMIARTTELYRQSKGETRKNHAETLETLKQKQQALQLDLQKLMKTYGEKQRQAIYDMQDLVLKDLPGDVKLAALRQKLDSNNPEHRETLLELYESMHPVEFREKELEARKKSFGNVDSSFTPMRNTPEGQLLSDVKKSFTQENLDEQWMKDEKKKSKEKKRKNKVEAKIHLGKRAQKGEPISDEEKEKAEKGEITNLQWLKGKVGFGAKVSRGLPGGKKMNLGGYRSGKTEDESTTKKDEDETTETPQDGTGESDTPGVTSVITPWKKATRSEGQQTGAPGGFKIGMGRTSQQKHKIQDTDKITEDSDKASEILGYLSKGTKIGGKVVVKPLLKQVTGGTQDDEGLLRAIPTPLALGSEVADMAGSILLIKDGNSAQKKLGQKKLFDNIFGVFGALGKTVRASLKSAEQFQLSEAVEGSTATSLSELGVPIVGAIVEGAKLVKAAVDAGMQGKTAKKFGDLKQVAKEKGGQTGALKGALKHGEKRSYEMMTRSIVKGVTSGLALVGHILTATGVGAIVGESIKMIVRGIRLGQKVGEKLRDSYRTGKELEARYKARTNQAGSENTVFALSGKYASTALLRRALDGDEVAIKAVKQHGIDASMLQDIRDGKVLFAQARELIMHDWKEKDNPETLGMKLKEGLDKVKKKIDGLLKDEKDSDKQDGPQPSIQHLGNQPLPEGTTVPVEDYDNPTDYEAPKQKQSKLDKLKGGLSSVGKTALSVPGKIGKAVTGAPGKIKKAVGTTVNYKMGLAKTKWQFIKVVKDTVQYGGEGKRGGNWVLNRILSKDSDVDEQFALVVDLIYKEELFQDNADARQKLYERMVEILDLEQQLKEKYKIKEKEDETEADNYMY